ncbi:hypothetical protein BGZ60DRAFT_403085 [Tricladium varicosporioides]|nr:hypothetical protein BGZ60DRAFT_403085 [Hymenoscyphus varicosporioides]
MRRVAHDWRSHKRLRDTGLPSYWYDLRVEFILCVLCGQDMVWLNKTVVYEPRVLSEVLGSLGVPQEKIRMRGGNTWHYWHNPRDHKNRWRVFLFPICRCLS